MENIMRLPEFLQKVDTLTNEMSKNELTQFIYQLGRQLPEYKRYSFLSLLEDIHYSRVEIEDTTFENDVNSLIKRLESIQSKERKLDSGLNEEWDDWYNPTVPEYLFMDSEGILNDIKLGITYIHKCIDIESYSLGNRLVEALVFLEVETTGDYPECENSCYLNLATLEEYQCIDVDLNDLCNECIFLSYMANSQEERAKKIYSILEAFGLFSDRMESIMKLGKEELKDFDLFLNDWIDYLGVKENTHVENLLLEAQSLLLDENKR